MAYQYACYIAAFLNSIGKHDFNVKVYPPEFDANPKFIQYKFTYVNKLDTHEINEDDGSTFLIQISQQIKKRDKFSRAHPLKYVCPKISGSTSLLPNLMRVSHVAFQMVIMLFR